MSAGESQFLSVLLDDDCDRVARFPGNRITCAFRPVDAFFPEQVGESFGHVVVFSDAAAAIAIDDCDLAAESAHCLR